MGAKRMGYFSREEFVGGESPALKPIEGWVWSLWICINTCRFWDMQGCLPSRVPAASPLHRHLWLVASGLSSQAQLGLLTALHGGNAAAWWLRMGLGRPCRARQLLTAEVHLAVHSPGLDRPPGQCLK